MNRNRNNIVADMLDLAGGCYFGKKETCGSVIFFGVVGSLALSITVVKHMLKYFNSKLGLKSMTEFYTFLALAINWSIVAVIIAVGNPESEKSGFGNAVVVLPWVNIVAHCLSATIAFTEYQIEGN